MQIARGDAVVSLMSCVSIVTLPLGGYLATRYRIPNIVMIGGLPSSIVLGALSPSSPYPFLFFILLGIGISRLAMPVVGSLAAEVLDAARARAGLWHLLSSGTSAACRSSSFPRGYCATGPDH